MTEYRHKHFQRKLLAADLRFRKGPGLGESMPDFDLPTINGGRLRKEDFIGERPLLLAFASVTSPTARSASPMLRKLHGEYGNRLAFVSLYVREAHPGDRYPQPSSLERKMAHARAYADRDRIEWPVAVDDVDGTLHRALDTKQSAVYLMDTRGRIAYRLLHSNDEKGLRRAIRAVLAGRRGEKQARLLPSLRGVACMMDVLKRAGPQAELDLRTQAPPVYALARLAYAARRGRARLATW